MTRASAYIHRERLCVIGVHEHRLGPIPFAITVKLDAAEPEGPVDLGKDLSPVVQKAFDEAEAQVREKVQEGQLQLAAENLVLRSRQGDQNAMAILASVHKNAKQGNPKAQKALTVIKKYIKGNPVEPSSFGLDEALHEADNPYAEDAAIICFGPLDTSKLLGRLLGMGALADKVKSISLSYPIDHRRSFLAGFKLANRAHLFGRHFSKVPNDYQCAGVIGLICGKALAIQGIRGGGPIKRLSYIAGWELGE